MFLFPNHALSKRIHNYDDNDLAELVTHICSIREAAIE